jgi:O-antigen/teichoic acid export membrane protein
MHQKINSFQIFQLLKYVGVMISAILMTHAGYSKVDINIYEGTTFWVSVVSFFWIGSVLNTYLIFKEKEAIGLPAFVFTLARMSGFSAIALLIIYFTMHIQISLYLALALVLFNGVSFILEYYFYKHNKTNLLYIDGVLTMIFPCIAVILCHSIDQILFFILIVSVLKSIYIGCVIFSFNKKEQTYTLSHKDILAASLPLMMSMALSGSGDYLDGVMVAEFFPDQFGMYRYGARELPFIFVLLNALSTSMLSQVAFSLEIGMQEIRKRSLFLMHIGFVMAGILMYFSKDIFELLLTPAYRDSAIIFNVYLLLLIPRSIFPQTILNGTKNTQWIMKGSMIDMIINLGASWIFMKIFGLIGIAMGTVLSFSVEKIYLSYILKTKMNIDLNKYIPLYWWMGYSSLLIFLFIVCC